ncbi:hypothetical protein [Flavobacterium mesophilum]|uniref:hypothetical protein n=1 Tax=Flavobacterium mesophilum TaxID=3143495 RepID=UPI0031D7E7B7
MKKIISLLSIIFFSYLIRDFSSLTPLVLLTILPGFLFGISITIPRLAPKQFQDYKKLLLSLVYILLWIFSLNVISAMQMLTYSINDITPYLILGVISGFLISFLFNFQFGFAKKKIAFTSIITLSILACLIFNFYYPNLDDKALNIGKQIFIWNVLVGIGLTLNKEKEMNEKKDL